MAQGPGQVSTVRHGSALPTACSPTQGQIFFLNNDGLYSCTATNTWTKGSGGSSTWGGITGTLSNQTDLQTALNGKVPTTRAVAGHPLSADVAIACADLSNDGDACAKNTGTATGTLAAGDDSRIVNAVPNTRTVAGKALSTNITLASTDLSDSANVVKTNAAATFGAFSYDFSASSHLRPVGGLTASKPGTCNPPEVYFATDATAGQNWYFCTATNTWTQQLNSGGGGGNTTSTSLTPNTLPKANGANSIVNSLLSDDGTTASYTGTGGISTGKVAATGSNGGFDGTEGTAAGLTAAVGHDLLYPDSTAHRWKMNNNNGGAVQVVASGVDINTSDQVTATHLAAPLPVAQGGNGSASPGIVAGANCTVTGSWPTQTINCTGGAGGGLGYNMQLRASGTPGASQTWYFGDGNFATQSTDTQAFGRQSITVPKACTVKAVWFRAENDNSGTPASSENVTYSIRVNNTTDTAVGTGNWGSFPAINSFTALSGPVLAAGDTIVLKAVTPAWVTAPAGTWFFQGGIYCE